MAWTSSTPSSSWKFHLEWEQKKAQWPLGKP
eukprot:CAMPEP_0194769344 /NCGR_PEP_ID=MMETSP0323_2-20130528/42648_1 /TAXON_ID=2866 ORGANISM="Crypthecodinium cohnii, Strain Seligo" /NCGR_SAMPLE_ID=MMETSP0323_2 /ASSEMBLY_ACC=CAM_ASM_000346 /LENGTH=30 /DNA_ID= /DNA_START= /DNA_END= /DNA_ORIENTATION=